MVDRHSDHPFTTLKRTSERRINAPFRIKSGRLCDTQATRLRFGTEALADKAKALKERRVRQLGELVAATGADALDAELLTGALLDAAAMKDAATREGWRKAAAAFFSGPDAQVCAAI